MLTTEAHRRPGDPAQERRPPYLWYGPDYGERQEVSELFHEHVR